MDCFFRGLGRLNREIANCAEKIANGSNVLEKKHPFAIITLKDLSEFAYVICQTKEKGEGLMKRMKKLKGKVLACMLVAALPAAQTGTISAFAEKDSGTACENGVTVTEKGCYTFQFTAGDQAIILTPADSQSGVGEAYYLDGRGEKKTREAPKGITHTQSGLPDGDYRLWFWEMAEYKPFDPGTVTIGPGGNDTVTLPDAKTGYCLKFAEDFAVFLEDGGETAQSGAPENSGTTERGQPEADEKIQPGAQDSEEEPAAKQTPSKGDILSFEEAAGKPVDKVLQGALTDEEQRRVQGGEDAQIRLVVTKPITEVSKTDKRQIEEDMDSLAGQIQGLTRGPCLGISLLKKVGGGEWKKLRKSNQELEIVLDIPQGLKTSFDAGWDGRDDFGLERYGEAVKDCFWHWLILAVNVFGALEAVLAYRHKKSYVWIVLGICFVLSGLLAAAGDCFLDWLFGAAGMLLIGASVAFVHNVKVSKEDDLS